LFSREDNLAEYLSALFLLLSSFLFLKSLISLILQKKNSNKWIMILLSFTAIILFLAAGEEISWGQRIFDIPTPEYLLKINDQNELNFHNINKRFFDRILDRLTIIFVIVGSIYFLKNKNKILGLKAPNLYVICAFSITPFYRQNLELNFLHIIYLPLIIILIYSLIKKIKNNIKPIIITLIMTFIIQFIHTKFGYLFPSSNNSANEFKEFMFCLCILIYSYEIMNEIITEKKAFANTVYN
tara:strand:+ start:66 stop:788 length:723 start_codon:yes stop_codon:yes gene_type:complete